MPIIPRANPGDVARIDALPGVRNTAKSPGSVGLGDAIADVTRQGLDIYQQHRDRVDASAFEDAQRQLAEWENHWNDPNNPQGRSAYQGTKALQLGDAMLPDHDKAVASIADRLPSPRVRQKFAEFAGMHRAQVQGQVNDYASRENEQALAQSHKAYLDTAQQQGIANAGDDRAFDAWRETTKATLYVHAGANGTPQDVVDHDLATMVSTARATHAQALMDSDPTAAHAYLETHHGEIEPGTLATLETKLQPLVSANEYDDTGRAKVFGGTVQQVTGPDGTPVGTAPTEPKSVQASYQAIAARNGFTISSMVRTKVLNVGAGARSQHLKGTAVDYSVRGKTDAQVQALMADLRSAGFEVIDERDPSRKDSTGPHIHAELPPPGARASGHVATAKAIGPAGSLGEVLERIRTDPRASNPIWRREVTQAATHWWSVREADEADRDKNTLESLRAKIDGAPAGTPLPKILGSDYSTAVTKGWVGTLQTIVNAKAEGRTIQTNPLVFDRFARLLATNQGEFAKPQTIKAIMEHAGDLSTQDLAELRSKWETLQTPKGAKAGEDFATDEQIINANASLLGYDKLKDDQRTPKVADFRMAYTHAKRAWIEANPGKPFGAEQADSIARLTRQNFARNPNAGAQARAAESLGMTAGDRRAMRDALIRRGIANPSEQQVADAVIAAYTNRTKAQ